jgi:4-hydroxythreonine-4-phosphate dehydrogenase
VPPLLAISAGDPGGIGPEVLAAALADPARRARARVAIFAPARAILDAPHARALPLTIRPDAPDLGPPPAPGEIVLIDLAPPHAPTPWPATDNAPAGEASFRAVNRAIDLALRPPADPWHAHAVVTGPISKRAWALAGHADYPGHTELLAARCTVAHATMAFHAPPPQASDPTPLRAGLSVALVTVHRPLRDVPALLTPARITDTIARAHDFARQLGVASPRVGVCGLNPHAGEGGLLGTEDRDLIAPAVRAARDAGIDAQGPLPADTIFGAALAFPDAPPARFDIVVAMYHDQGLIPLKTLARDRAVNVSLGLHIIRTSPDHGTAFDIAGRASAHPGSMAAAIDLAVRLAGHRAGA